MAEIDPARLHQELEEMRQLVKSDPDVLDHFDTNGDGRIDGDEWQAVVEMVTKRLQREANEMAQYREAMGEPAPEQPPEPLQPPRQHAEGELASELYNEEVQPYVQLQLDPPELGLSENALEEWEELMVIRDGGTLTELMGSRSGFALMTRNEQELGRVVAREGQRGFELTDNLSGRTLLLEQQGKRLAVVETPNAEAIAWASWDSGWVRDRVHMGWGDIHGTATESMLSGPFSLELNGKTVARLEQDYSGMGSIFRGRMDMVYIKVLDLEPGPSRWALIVAALIVEFRNQPKRGGSSAFDIFMDLIDD